MVKHKDRGGWQPLSEIGGQDDYRVPEIHIFIAELVEATADTVFIKNLMLDNLHPIWYHEVPSFRPSAGISADT